MGRLTDSRGEEVSAMDGTSKQATTARVEPEAGPSPTKVADLPTRKVEDAKAGQVKGGAKRPIQPCL
jgi:hypothetical protein